LHNSSRNLEAMHSLRLTGRLNLKKYRLTLFNVTGHHMPKDASGSRGELTRVRVHVTSITLC